MKPRTKLQKEVAALMHKVNGLTAPQLRWAKKRCFTPKAYSCKSKAWCSECGEEFKVDVGNQKHIVCPVCGERLEVVKRIRRKHKYEENGFDLITTCEGWQVIRSIEIRKTSEKGQKAAYDFCDVCQNWIHKSGKDVIVAKMIAGIGWQRRYAWWSDSEIRPGSAMDNAYCRILNFSLRYPKQRLIPEVVRNGYDKRKCKKLSQFRVFTAILSNPMSETLLKAGQMSAFEASIYNSSNVRELWPQLKICIRNKYIVSDFGLWKDYVGFLEALGKDVHNPHYICPKDLKTAHDVYMLKKQKKDAEDRLREQAQEILDSENDYFEKKHMFFGIAIRVDDIDIQVLKTVEDVFKEGEAMHHCVFTNRYYEDDDSVLLSARRNGERVETIEYSLEQGRVLQSRGVCNKNTEYHDIIVNAINSHSHLFQRARSS